MTRTIQYKITRVEEGLCVSQVLFKHRFSKQNIAELKWKQDSILLDKIPVKMNQKVKENQILTVILTEQKKSDQIKPRQLPFPIVYEDEDILVINKPAGMPSQPSWYYEESSLASAASYYWKMKGWKPFVYRCINRLDKDTSGLLILAKHSLAGAILNQMHQTGELVRTYYAIVENADLLPEEGWIDAPIGKDLQEANRYQVDFENGLSARTHYQKLETKGNIAFLEIHLETGRTHQIRVHMSYLGHPLIGDPTYNNGSIDDNSIDNDEVISSTDNRVMERQALHAGRLEFPHPITQKRMQFWADLPENMKTFGFLVNK